MNRRTDDPENEDFSATRKMDWLKYVSPILLTINLFLLSGIQGEISGVKSDIKDTNSMLFKHLTNDEMHCPRSITVTKPEFAIYQSMRDKQMNDTKDGIDRIENLLEKHMGYNSKG